MVDIKKFSKVLGSIISLFILLNGQLAEAGWYIVTVDSEGDVGKYPPLGFDSDDMPFVSYYDARNGDLKLITEKCRCTDEERIAVAKRSVKQLLSEEVATTTTSTIRKVSTFTITVPSVTAPSMGKSFTNSIEMKFVFIPPGTFMMGSPPNERGRDNDERQHQVTLTKGFYMQSTEVTQGQWKAVMGNNPSKFKDCGDKCPVENVSWNDCQHFIRTLNEIEKTNKYRLPTEAEWEYACRASSTTSFANGGIKELKCGYEPHLDKLGWYCGNAFGKTYPVAKKEPNAWSLYDMHGNVWEWCSDRYGKYPSGSVTDPEGLTSGSSRVVRGGSWHIPARFSRSASRGFASPGVRYFDLGFRLARME